MHHTAAFRAFVPPPERPEALAEPRPQEWVQRHTVEQLADVAPKMQFLEACVSQMVDQLMDAFRLLDSPVAEQVIAVPKISCPSRAARTVLVEPQVAGQLVEVPTAVSYSFLQQRTAEQDVDIPVARTRAGGRLQGFPSGHGSLAFGGADHRVRRSFLPRQGSTAFRGPEHHDDDGFLTEQSSAAFRGAEHHDDDGFLTEQSSAAFRGDHHHDDVDFEDELVEVRHDDWVSMVDEHSPAGTVVTTRRTGACLPECFTGGCVSRGGRFWRSGRRWRFCSSPVLTVVDVPVFMIVLATWSVLGCCLMGAGSDSFACCYVSESSSCLVDSGYLLIRQFTLAF